MSPQRYILPATENDSFNDWKKLLAIQVNLFCYGAVILNVYRTGLVFMQATNCECPKIAVLWIGDFMAWFLNLRTAVLQSFRGSFYRQLNFGALWLLSPPKKTQLIQKAPSTREEYANQLNSISHLN